MVEPKIILRSKSGAFASLAKASRFFIYKKKKLIFSEVFSSRSMKVREQQIIDALSQYYSLQIYYENKRQKIKQEYDEYLEYRKANCIRGPKKKKSRITEHYDLITAIEELDKKKKADIRPVIRREYQQKIIESKSEEAIKKIEQFDFLFNKAYKVNRFKIKNSIEFIKKQIWPNIDSIMQKAGGEKKFLIRIFMSSNAVYNKENSRMLDSSGLYGQGIGINRTMSLWDYRKSDYKRFILSDLVNQLSYKWSNYFSIASNVEQYITGFRVENILGDA